MKLFNLSILLTLTLFFTSTASAQTAKIVTPLSVSTSNSYPGNEPFYATDGDPSTFWSAGGFAPQWIQLDLGQTYAISKVRLNILQSPAGQTTHQIYGGSDPNNLTLIGTLSGSTQDGQWLELLTATKVRYLRINTVASPSWVAWREIQVYPTNSRIFATALTASNSYPTNDSLYAADGDMNTFWSAGGFAPQWIQLDLGQTYAISKVRLNVVQSPAGQTTHQIYGGSDPNNLILLGTLDGYTQDGQWLELLSSATNVRYVRINTTNSLSWIAWREIQVYSGNTTQALIDFGYFSSANTGVGYGQASGGADSNDYTSEIADHSNVSWIAGSNSSIKLQEAASLGMKSVMDVSAVFFDSNGNLQPYYQIYWNNYADSIQGNIQNVAAFYPMDEPFIRNGQAVGQADRDRIKSNLETAISTIKQRFPQTPVAVIFGYPTVREDNNVPFLIPTGYDWIGFDCYGPFGDCDNQGHSIPWYVSAVENKLNSTQRMIMIPQGFYYSNDLSHPSDVEIVNRAEKYFSLAQSDSTFVGMFPFLFQSFSDGVNSAVGTRDLPAVHKKYQQVGGSIVKQP